ncbi:hypothetical protein HKX48_007765 [Thoreauomyces humboldtii]|nr:hypothetical protein HKX48_007765 [Thoreauomyces humboldtii]
MDSAIDCPTPKSVPKYTEKDVERMQAELKARLEAEYELMAQETMENFQKEQAAKWKQATREWDTLRLRLIDEKNADRDQAALEYDRIYESLHATHAEKIRLAKENDVWEVKNKQLKLDLSDMRESTKLLTGQIDELKQHVTQRDEQYAHLKAHAQEKLNCANDENEKLANAHALAMSTMDVKLSRLDSKVKTLEVNLQAKNEAYNQLEDICDGLVRELDSRGGAER